MKNGLFDDRKLQGNSLVDFCVTPRSRDEIAAPHTLFRMTRAVYKTAYPCFLYCMGVIP